MILGNATFKYIPHHQMGEKLQICELLLTFPKDVSIHGAKGL